MQYDKGKLSAVAAMPYHNHTVMFVGTDHGQLFKVPSVINKQKHLVFNRCGLQSADLE